MGGNMKDASTGPDRSRSTCNDCGESFTHGKYTTRRYCGICRDDQRDPEKVTTSIEVDQQLDRGRIEFEVRIENENDVPTAKIPLESTGDTASCVGYIRVVGEDAVAEDAWITRFHTAGQMRISEESYRSVRFVWDSDGFRQAEKPTDVHNEPTGETFREKVALERGDPLTEDSLKVVFMPGKTSDYVDDTEVSVDLHDYLIDL